MSLMALVPAMRPKSKASSTMGEKKSVVLIRQRPSPRSYTAASSRVPYPTSRCGSGGRGAALCRIFSSSAGAILQPQPAPWLRVVRRTGSAIDVQQCQVKRRSIGGNVDAVDRGGVALVHLMAVGAVVIAQGDGGHGAQVAGIEGLQRGLGVLRSQPFADPQDRFGQLCSGGVAVLGHQALHTRFHRYVNEIQWSTPQALVEGIGQMRPTDGPALVLHPDRCFGAQ